MEIFSFVIIRAMAYTFVAYIAWEKKNLPIFSLMVLLTLSALHPEYIPWDGFYEVILIGFPASVLWIGWDISRTK